VRCLLDSAGYGTVARLKGIFICTYPDRDSIPAGELGYAALAQGLGLVQGSYNGRGSATRAQRRLCSAAVGVVAVTARRPRRKSI
jgi:hypothetical protein